MEWKDEKGVHLSQYLRILKKRKWTLTTFLVVVVTTVAVWTFKMEPVYRGTTQILIEKENPNVVSFKEVLELEAGDQEYYQTQYKILKSRSLSKRVVDTLGLKESDEFSPNHLTFFKARAAFGTLIEKVSAPKNLKKWSNAMVNGTNGVGRDRDGDGWLIDAFLKRVKVEPVRRSRLVNVIYEGYNPILVAKITNSIAQNYIDQNLEARLQASQNAVAWLGERLKRIKKKLEDSEAALQRYKEDKKIVSASLGERRNTVGSRLNELSSNLTQAKTERIGLETLYNQVKYLSKKPGMIESVPEVIKNPLIQELKVEYSRVQAEYAELSKRYGHKNPKIIRLISRLEAMNGKIAFEVEKIIKGVETEYKVAKAKEASLLQALEAQKKEALGLNKKAIKFRALEREVESNRQIYTSLLKRAAETGLTSELENVNIRIIDPAEVPRKPAKPRILLNLSLAVLVGFTMGTGLVFFVEYLDGTVKNPEDIEEFLEIPCLGSLGKFSSSEVASELFVIKESNLPYAESIKTARTNIVYSMEALKARSLLITSAGPEEGKTVFSANLAASLAQMGKKVLLVDADIRKPRIHSIFNQDRAPGLSCALRGDISKVMIHPTPVENLKVLTAGQRAHDSSELLSSEKLLELMDFLHGKFDHIIFDTSPIMAVTDSLVLARAVDASVLVVKSGGIPKEIVKRALAQLTFSLKSHSEAWAEGDAGTGPEDGRPSKLIGALLNFVDIREDFYYYHYQKYYRKYYAEESAA